MTAPRWAAALLRRAATPGRTEDVLGDLEEAHRGRVRKRGRLIGTLLTGFEALDVAITLVRQRVRRRLTPGQPPGPQDKQSGSGRTRWISWIDLKLGLRMLVKYPGLTLIGGLGMAVAIAISAGSFAFFYSYLYPTLPLDQGERIVGLENWDVEVNNEERQSLHDFVAWREEMRSVEDVGAFRTVARNLILPGRPAEPVFIGEMTASGFRVARVPPLLGRPLRAEDEQIGAPPVLVIGYDVWQTRFAGERDVVGRDVRIGNTAHTVVGVMPQGYAFPMNHSYWKPLHVNLSDYERGQGPEIFIFGRLVTSATFEEAQAELTAIGQRSAVAFPETHARLRPQVLPYTYPLVDIQDVSVWQIGVMLAFVSLLLVVVAVNVAVLTYARTATRRGEIAVRTALGAPRSRIVVQLAVEAFVLAAAAAAGGLALAGVGLRLGNRIMAEEVTSLPFWTDFRMPPVTVLYVVGLTILVAVIVGVVPGVQATGRGLQSSLRQVSGGSGMQLGRTWTALIIAQVAIAVVGLPAAVATGWTEILRGTTEPTFAEEEFIAGRLVMDQERPPGVELETYQQEYASRYTSFQIELMRRLQAEPGVSDVTFTLSYPGYERRTWIEIDDGSSPAASAPLHEMRINQVGVDFFETFDVPILTGRPFHAGDPDAEAPPVIVNRTFVQRKLAGGNALGRRVRYVGDGQGASGDRTALRWHEIVGVVGDLHANAIDPEAAVPVMYHPIAPGSSTRAVLIATRVQAGTQASMAPRIRQITTALDPTLRLAGASTLEVINRQAALALQLVALVLGSILISVLLLSAAGIYALMSFTVTQRRREIGIRTALGAQRHAILGSIFARALRQLAIGVGVGVVAAVVMERATGGGLMGGRGAVMLPAVAVMMIAAGLVAALGPARRGLRIQPTEALREG